MHKISFLKKQKGFTMVELIATIAVLSFGIIAVYSAFSSTIVITYNISSKFTAAYLAQEGLEVVRNIRDNNFIRRISNPGIVWSSGLTSCTLGCQGDYKSSSTLQSYNPNGFLNINSDGFYSYDGGTPTKFKRKITINQSLGTDTLYVNVQVTWNYNGTTYSIDAEEYLYNWY